MKKLILLLLVTGTIGSLCLAQTISRADLRENFIKATKCKTALDSFDKILEKISARTAAEECYLGMCEALNIQYTDGMWRKYKMLDQSRGHIAKAIAQAPQDAELRFLRFMLEHNIPGFLGMSTHIQNDLAFIFGHSGFLEEDMDLRKIAMEFILSSKRCTTEQTAMLQKNLDELKKKQYAQK
ncbi:MAG: hypothetical protein JWO03_1082 [Bacteroidetes bacterium]|nr:hypothetical protein [Bacteroidota bacterium]